MFFIYVYTIAPYFERRVKKKRKYFFVYKNENYNIAGYYLIVNYESP